MSATVFVCKMHRAAHEQTVGMAPEADTRKYLNVSRKRTGKPTHYINIQLLSKQDKIILASELSQVNFKE